MIFRSYRSARRVAACAVSIFAAAGLILVSQPAAAQLGATFLATPQGQRLTQQERADLELTQIAPDFQLYREWIFCLNETARNSLDDGKSIERATSLMSIVCEGGELPLRASLARSVGLPRARRIIAILYANKLAEMRVRYTKLRTPAPGTLATIQGWSLIRDDASCMAVSRSQGPLSLQTQVIRRTSAGYSLIIHTAGSDAKARSDVQAGSSIIVLWHHYRATQYGEQMFTSVPIDDGYAVETPLGPKLLSVLPNYDQFQRGSNETFSIEGIAEVIGALEGCYVEKFSSKSPVTPSTMP